MDPRERWGDPEEAQRLAMMGLQALMWSALPAVVVSFDPETCTSVVQPAVGGVRYDADGAPTATTLPVISDVPVVFPTAGGCALTLPVRAGDEVLLVFSSRPIDSWWQSGGVQRPAGARMHDLADAFAIPGPVSRPAVLPNISTSQAQLRNEAGTASISLNPDTGAVSIVAPGGVAISGGPLTHNGKNVGETHTHGGVASGGSNTSVPN